MIGIVDYGMGNIRSVYHAFEMIGAGVVICRTPHDLGPVERIVLPGVGAFKDCLHNLHAAGFVGALQQAVFDQNKPILGICLGMQAMAQRSFEGGRHQGLGWIKGDVVHLAPADASCTGAPDRLERYPLPGGVPFIQRAAGCARFVLRPFLSSGM